MKLAIFGGTGKTGKYLVEQALAEGNHVTALVRNPNKLAIQNPHLTLVQGEIGNAAAVERTIAGADAVISVLGPTSNAPEFQVSTGMQNIIAAMKKHGVRRLVVSTGAGVGDPNDEPKLFHHLMNFALALVSRNVYEDMKRTVDVVRASELDWTIVRVPMLTDDQKIGRVQVGYVGKGMGPRITRADMADFILKQVSDRQFVRQAPAISN
ncbi:MAG TPA: SDR family oxidoreductase [Anaerolineae bacterium]|nr:SDR family oxidoreductase [Anaerolineae bacterium]